MIDLVMREFLPFLPSSLARLGQLCRLALLTSRFSPEGSLDLTPPALSVRPLHTVQKEKGGDPEVVRESQRKRGASVELVDEVLERYTAWTKRAS